MRPSCIAFAILAVIGFSLGIRGADAAEMKCDKIGVCLVAPSPWQEKSIEKDVSLVPPDERQNAQKRRRLHIVIPANPADSLEEEMYREMDRCDARAPQWGSSNGRKGFLASTPVKTKSGIEGIRAKQPIKIHASILISK